ncbi:MAG TPA: diguanylate cyclase [Methylibium sp.]|nr:diguanylate cyclase [Methylibium sp.]
MSSVESDGDAAERRSAERRLVQRMRWPRGVGLGLGGVAVGGALWQVDAAAPWWGLLALNALVWPQLACAWGLRSRRPRPEQRNLLIDAALGGLWLPVMGFNPLPSVLIATMLLLNTLAFGGRPLFLRALVALAAVALPATGLFAAPLQLLPTWPTLLACLPFLAVYPLMIGASTHRLSMRLAEQKREIERSERLHRQALDEMEAGIVLYDADDRLRLWNRDFSRLYAPLAEAMVPGRRFEDLLRDVVACGLVPQARGDTEDWIQARLVEHRTPGAPFLREFPGGRWRRIVERRLPDGGLLAFSTDVTELVQRERQLLALNEQLDLQARELQAANRRLEELSDTDALTGVANRRCFERRLQDEWGRGRRHGAPLALLLVDVDHFKRYNDAHGHPRGDDCLRRIAEVLGRCARRGDDLVARYGGEEFVLLLPHTPGADAAVLAGRCLQAIEDAGLPHGDSPIASIVTLSIGIAVARPCAGDAGPAALVERADAALYAAKAAGRRRAVAAEDVASLNPNPPATSPPR